MEGSGTVTADIEATDRDPRGGAGSGPRLGRYWGLLRCSSKIPGTGFSRMGSS